MTALKKTQRKHTLEEYADIEKSSDEKFEFYDGDVWSMAGASPKHEIIVVNLSAELRSNLRGRGCRIYAQT
jgi:Uma2 family endonuclease